VGLSFLRRTAQEGFMAVFVDDMFHHRMGRFGRLKCSHMVADTDEELHAMAARIGVSEKWWQSPDKTSGSHYDIAMSKRALAINAGAIPITMRQLAAMNARRHVTGELGDPTTAIEWLRARRNMPQAAPTACVRQPAQPSLFPTDEENSAS
jgi:hypothetical protein